MEEKDYSEKGEADASGMRFEGLTFVGEPRGIYIAPVGADSFRFKDSTFTNLKGVVFIQTNHATDQ